MARALSEKNTQSTYDEYLHIGSYAFFDSRAYVEIRDGMDALSTISPPLPEHAPAAVLIRAGDRTHNAMNEAARTRLGGQVSADPDQLFA
jgi:hypothetical protein